MKNPTVIHGLRLIVVLCVMASAMCGTAMARMFSYGVTGGMNITRVDGKKFYTIDAWHPNSEQGWDLGLKLRVIGPLMGIGGDASLLFSRERLSITDTNDDAICYFALPIHARWEIGIGDSREYFAPYIFTGPQFRYSSRNLKFDLDEDQDPHVRTQEVHCRYDLGAGFLILERVELGYNYSVPMNHLFNLHHLRDGAEDVRTNYRSGTHNFVMTIYF